MNIGSRYKKFMETWAIWFFWMVITAWKYEIIEWCFRVNIDWYN